MKNILVFAKNYEKYTSGYYHQDLVDALGSNANISIYGPGYPHYNSYDRYADILQKLGLSESDLNLIIFTTSWDEDGSKVSVDPHPNLDVSSSSCRKVYFLNKEYKKLDKRFLYVKNQNIDLVVTVHPNARKWQKNIGVPFLYLPFGISLSRFKDRNLPRKYDFAFTGGLHLTHNDMRYQIKQRIFKSQFHHIKSNRGLSGFFRQTIKEEYRSLEIYWAEWGARNFIGSSMLPWGEDYAKFMNSCKTFLNTPSAIGIFNTRFFELMSIKTLILCPKDDSYGNLLIDGENCLMFKKDLSNFEDVFKLAIYDEKLRKKIVNKAHKDVKSHSYDKRIKTLLNYIDTVFG